MPVFVVTDPAGQREAKPLPSAPTPLAEPLSILSRLRRETRAEHDAVEQLLDLIGGSLTHEGYRDRLKQFYGFYGPIEQALRTRCTSGHQRPGRSADVVWSLAARQALLLRLNKTALLQQDLHHLGVLTGTLPVCSELPPLETRAEVLGCLYVLEGATLGGRLITQHVRTTFGITPATGGSFFEGYGDATGRMWQAMRNLLISSAPDTPTGNATVANAIVTFACLRRWCEPDESQSERHRRT